MRKKQWIICAALVALIIAFVIYSVYADVSPEFEAAKKLAMTATPDGDGDLVIGKRVIDSKTTYMIGYFPRLKSIAGGILTDGKMLSVIYDEEKDSYGATLTDADTGKILVIRKITKEKASEMMANILKRLVNTGIPI